MKRKTLESKTLEQFIKLVQTLRENESPVFICEELVQLIQKIHLREQPAPDSLRCYKRRKAILEYTKKASTEYLLGFGFTFGLCGNRN